jgi:hypothetical protein
VTPAWGGWLLMCVLRGGLWNVLVRVLGNILVLLGDGLLGNILVGVLRSILGSVLVGVLRSVLWGVLVGILVGVLGGILRGGRWSVHNGSVGWTCGSCDW